MMSQEKPAELIYRLIMLYARDEFSMEDTWDMSMNILKQIRNMSITIHDILLAIQNAIENLRKKYDVTDSEICGLIIDILDELAFEIDSISKDIHIIRQYLQKSIECSTDEEEPDEEELEEEKYFDDDFNDDEFLYDDE